MKNKLKYIQSVTTVGMPMVLQNGTSAESEDSTKTSQKEDSYTSPNFYEHSFQATEETTSYCFLTCLSPAPTAYYFPCIHDLYIIPVPP